MVFTNEDKKNHGKNAQNGLKEILQNCQKLNYLKTIEQDYRLGKNGYSNTKQFYAPFVIEFADNKKWALYSTTSMRTDRIKGQQWDAFNLKNLDESIVLAFLVYPDGINEKQTHEFIQQKRKYADCIEYSAIDDIVSQTELFNLIESYFTKYFDQGTVKTIQGNNFENRIASILNCDQNFKKWKFKDATVEGIFYGAFKQIVKCLNINKEQTKRIEATSDKKHIGKLPSKGNPKTDVLVLVTNTDDTQNLYTISCKRSSNNSVSVHEYSADQFSLVLDPQNHNLRNLLNLFQEAGSLKDFGYDNCNKLTKELEPYLRKLTLWVLGGHGGEGNPDTQYANYILTYDNNDDSIAIHNINDYCTKLLASKSGHFGTPFSWTYPSKKRGKKIQLKCKLLK